MNKEKKLDELREKEAGLFLQEERLLREKRLLENQKEKFRLVSFRSTNSTLGFIRILSLFQNFLNSYIQKRFMNRILFLRVF